MRLLWAAVLFNFFLAVYMLTNDKTYHFDGVLMGGTVEEPLTQLPAFLAFEWNHFLWYPTARVFYLFLHAVKIPLRGYETNQLLNNIAGAAGISVLFFIFSAFTNRAWALVWSVIPGFCQTYWTKSISAENYLFGTFWVICSCGALTWYWRKPGGRNVVVMGICCMLAFYYHIGNVVVWVLAYTTILCRNKLKESRVVTHTFLLSVLLAITLLIYGSIQDWFHPGGFARWWKWGSTLTQGFSPYVHAAGGFRLVSIQSLLTVTQTLIRSVLWWDVFDARSVVLFVVFILPGVLAVLYGRWKSRSLEQKRQPDIPSYVLLFPALLFIGFYTIWNPWDLDYWSVHPPLISLAIGAYSFRRQPGRMTGWQTGLFALLIGLIAWHNFNTRIKFLSKNPDQFVVDASLTIGRITPPESPVVISGKSNWNSLKPYLPYFAHRNRLALDLFIVSGIQDGKEPIRWISETVAGYLHYGVPVYMMEEAIKTKDQFADFKISPDQIESIWKPYTLLPVRDFAGNPPSRFFLLWSNNIPQNLQDLICLRLKANRLYDQLLTVYEERMRANPSTELRNEIQSIQKLRPWQYKQ